MHIFYFYFSLIPLLFLLCAIIMVKVLNAGILRLFPLHTVFIMDLSSHVILKSYTAKKGPNSLLLYNLNLLLVIFSSHIQFCYLV